MEKKLKKLYIGTNTKMYQTNSDVSHFLNSLTSLTKDLDFGKIELFVIPPFTALDTAKQIISRSSIKLGAQNMAWEDSGQFTGEISPLMLKEIGVDIVMCGHSERRHILNESDFLLEKKVAKAAAHRFTPLLCIGETRIEKDYSLCNETLAEQLKIGLHSLSEEQANNLWIAYEPVWAIGQDGIPASCEYAEEKHGLIKDVLIRMFGKEIAGNIPVLYGGSVNQENAQDFIGMPHIDGLFIGRSAWDAARFNQIIRASLQSFLNKAHKEELS